MDPIETETEVVQEASVDAHEYAPPALVELGSYADLTQFGGGGASDSEGLS